MLQPENENPGIGRNTRTHEWAVGAEEDVEKKEPWQRLGWQWLTAVCSRNAGPFWWDLLEGQHGPALALYHLTKCCWGKDWISEKHDQMLNLNIALMGTSLLRMHKIYCSSTFFMQLRRNAAVRFETHWREQSHTKSLAAGHLGVPSIQTHAADSRTQRSQAILPRTWLQTASPGWRHCLNMFCRSRLGWQVLLLRIDRVHFTSLSSRKLVGKEEPWWEDTTKKVFLGALHEGSNIWGGLRFKAYCWCQGT